MTKTLSPRVLIFSIILICVLSLFGAWLVFKNPQWIKGSANYGSLIVPVVKIDRTKFTDLDPLSEHYLGELKGRWVMIHLITRNDCGLPCRESLNKTKQLRLMLHQDLMRVRRLLVVGENVAGRWISNLDTDDRLLKVRSGKLFIARVMAVLGRPLEEGMLFLMDPLGNLMMWYPPGFDPYHVKKDMKKLLNVSQIG